MHSIALNRIESMYNDILCALIKFRYWSTGLIPFNWKINEIMQTKMFEWNRISRSERKLCPLMNNVRIVKAMWSIMYNVHFVFPSNGKYTGHKHTPGPTLPWKQSIDGWNLLWSKIYLAFPMVWMYLCWCVLYGAHMPCENIYIFNYKIFVEWISDFQYFNNSFHLVGWIVKWQFTLAWLSSCFECFVRGS